MGQGLGLNISVPLGNGMGQGLGLNISIPLVATGSTQEGSTVFTAEGRQFKERQFTI